MLFSGCSECLGEMEVEVLPESLACSGLVLSLHVHARVRVHECVRV